jgi:SPX domain protein involved in polyphosphate accumulation
MTKQKSYQLHFRRLEFKYIVPTHILDLVVPTISRYLDADENANQQGFYKVNSLYFDSPQLTCYQQKLDGILFRKKYRLRYYDQKHEIFFEIKRKSGNTVFKDRVLLPPSIRINQQSLVNHKFLKHIPEGKLKGELLTDYHQLNLKPKVLISYLRRPFISKFTNNLRITLDYDLKASKITNGEFLDLNTTNYISPDLAVLEIKFNESLPAWVKHIIVAHNLERDSFSKYESAIEKLYQD